MFKKTASEKSGIDYKPIMKSLEKLTSKEASCIKGIIFDLDGTLLNGSSLTEEAYSALFAFKKAGIQLIACTGRPAGWGEVIIHQWPIDAAITENGAIAFIKTTKSKNSRERIITFTDERRYTQRPKLLKLAKNLIKKFPKARLADDNHLRRTDVAIDIGEHRHVDVKDIEKLKNIIRKKGFQVLESSVHLHLKAENINKATGTLALLKMYFGKTKSKVVSEYAFIGDSPNDASGFATFKISFGVANIESYRNKIPSLPKYKASFSMGKGFAEISNRIIKLRNKI